jgi:hypothetical protein
MKTTFHSVPARQGSVLVVTLVTGALIGIALVSYLGLVHHQNATVTRSQCWNAALAAAEAGVEEALAQLNPGKLTTNINRAANGWSLSGGSYSPPAARTLLNGSYQVRFTDTPYPTIYATGTITNAALKVALSRTIEVKTTNAPIFGPGITTIKDITVAGNNFNTDSYNSSFGGYHAKTNRFANGSVASVEGIVYGNNADIRGNLLTSPAGADSTNQFKNNGLVGDLLFKGPGIQQVPYHYADDFNVDFQDVALPAGSWSQPVPAMQNQNINGTKYDYAFLAGGGGSKTYFTTEINGLTGPLYVGSNVVVTLRIKGNVKLSGGADIDISMGGKLTIYMEGASFELLANSEINNYNKLPPTFAYFGLPSNTTLKIGGSPVIHASFYAPQADLVFTGDATLFGATVTRSAKFGGSTTFHYDEALAGPLYTRGYVAISWREL